MPRKGGLIGGAIFIQVAIMGAGVAAAVLGGRPGAKKSAAARTAPVIPGAKRVQEAYSKPEPVVTTATFEHHGSLVTRTGGLQILGVVTKTSTVAINAPRVQAIFRDAGGKEVHSEARSGPYDLEPGQKSPVQLLLTEIPKHESLGFEVSASERRGIEPAEGLNMAAVNAVPSKFGWRISGRVSNEGSKAARFVKVVVSAWDADDRLLGIRTVYVNDKRIESGAEARFQTIGWRLSGEAEQPRFEYHVAGRVDYADAAPKMTRP